MNGHILHFSPLSESIETGGSKQQINQSNPSPWACGAAKQDAYTASSDLFKKTLWIITIAPPTLYTNHMFGSQLKQRVHLLFNWSNWTFCVVHYPGNNRNKSLWTCYAVYNRFFLLESEWILILVCTPKPQVHIQVPCGETSLSK